MISSEFTKKKKFKLKKIERLIYKGYREKTEIDIISGQK